MSIDTYFCFCCLSTNELSNLFSSNADTNHVMLLKVLFSLKPSQDYEEDSYICTECAARLKDAYTFKQQVFDTINILQVNGLVELRKIKGDLVITKVLSEKSEKEAKDGVKNDTKSDVEYETDINNEEIIQDQKPQQPAFKNIKKEPIEIKNVEIIYGTEKVQPITNHPVNALEPHSKKGDQESYVVTDNLKCIVCMEALPNVYMYHRHMNEHFPNHICETCGKGFLTEKRLKRHMTSHDKGPFKCQSCDAIFTNYSTYNGHRQRKHSSQYHYACPHCTERFPTYARRALHLTAAHAQHGRKYLCPVCGKAFLLAGNLSQHVRSQHLKIKRYACKLCEGSFYHKQDLVSHTSTHTGHNQFLCTVCNKSFPRKKSLKVHLLTHSDQKPFCCDACGKKFNQKCALLSHVKTHNSLQKKRRSKQKNSSIVVEDSVNISIDISQQATNLVDLSPKIPNLEDLRPKMTEITPVSTKANKLVETTPAKVTNLVEVVSKVTIEKPDKVLYNCYKLFY